MLVLWLLLVSHVHGLQLLDVQANAAMEMKSASSPLSSPFNISQVALTLPMGHWASCRMNGDNREKIVLVTMAGSPCTIQDWIDMCETNQCAGLILHTLYEVPGLALSHREDQTPMVEVSNADGTYINDQLSAGKQLSVSMDSYRLNEWVEYFKGHEFIWAMTMPSSAAACIGILNFFKVKEKLGGVMSWKSVPIMHIVLVAAESVELGFRSALGFGLGTTQGTGFSFELFISLINLLTVIWTMANLTLGLALRDMYCTLMKQKPPLNYYLKLLTFVGCAVIFVLHYVYNIIPRKTGNDQWRLPIIGQIWAVMVIGTVALFLISSIKLSISFRRVQGQDEDNNWILRQVSIRLLQCAMAMTLDLIVIAVIAMWTYHSSPRKLMMSISIAGWTQNLTSIMKMRAIMVPPLPKKPHQSTIHMSGIEEDRSSKYLSVSVDEKVPQS